MVHGPYVKQNDGVFGDVIATQGCIRSGRVWKEQRNNGAVAQHLRDGRLQVRQLSPVLQGRETIRTHHGIQLTVDALLDRGIHREINQRPLDTGGGRLQAGAEDVEHSHDHMVFIERERCPWALSAAVLDGLQQGIRQVASNAVLKRLLMLVQFGLQDDISLSNRFLGQLQAFVGEEAQPRKVVHKVPRPEAQPELFVVIKNRVKLRVLQVITRSEHEGADDVDDGQDDVVVRVERLSCHGLKTPDQLISLLADFFFQGYDSVTKHLQGRMCDFSLQPPSRPEVAEGNVFASTRDQIRREKLRTSGEVVRLLYQGLSSNVYGIDHDDAMYSDGETKHIAKPLGDLGESQVWLGAHVEHVANDR